VKPLFPTVIFLLTNFCVPVAQADDDPKYLIQSCQELVSIYTEVDQLRTVAKVTTSFSEALRAGYCMGRADEYRRNYECATDDWFEQAKRIAAMPAAFSSRTSVDELLELSCEI